MWYKIDAVDRISALCPDWAQAAERNGAPGLVPAVVIGRPIWAFIEGAATSFQYARIFEAVRQRRRPAEFRLRNDGPARQSLLELRVEPCPRDELRITTRTIRERATLHTPLWDRALPRSGALVRVCSWCKAVEQGAHWLPAADAATAQPQLRAACPPEVVHHVCPGCENSLVRGQTLTHA